MEPETPIRGIVDGCRVWESHAEFVDHRGSRSVRDVDATFVIYANGVAFRGDSHSFGA